MSGAQAIEYPNTIQYYIMSRKNSLTFPLKYTLHKHPNLSPFMITLIFSFKSCESTIVDFRLIDSTTTRTFDLLSWM